MDVCGVSQTDCRTSSILSPSPVTTGDRPTGFPLILSMHCPLLLKVRTVREMALLCGVSEGLQPYYRRKLRFTETNDLVSYRNCTFYIFSSAEKTIADSDLIFWHIICLNITYLVWPKFELSLKNSIATWLQSRHTFFGPPCIYSRIYKNRWKLNNTCLLCAYLCAITCIRIASAFLLGGNISCIRETSMGVVGVGRFAMGVRLVWYGCPPASMGVSTPTVEYNSPPMLDRLRKGTAVLSTLWSNKLWRAMSQLSGI